MQVSSAGHHTGKWLLEMRIMNWSQHKDVKILPFPYCKTEGLCVFTAKETQFSVQMSGTLGSLYIASLVILMWVKQLMLASSAQTRDIPTDHVIVP